MTYRVEVAEEALREALEAAHWIAAHAPDTARGWLEGLSAAIDSLSIMPERCAIAPEAPFLGRPLRHLLFKSHRVIFFVGAKTVYIIAIRHAAMRPLD